MPLAEEIRKEVVQLSHQEKQNELTQYLIEKLKAGAVSPQDIFDYASSYQFTKKPNKPYVVSADSLNKLGVSVSKLDDEELKILAPQFYQLSAERGSAWGNRNYASLLLSGRFGVKKSKKMALMHAQKAVALESNVAKEQHNFVLCQALRENEEWRAANAALVEYLKFTVNKFHNTKADAQEPVKQDVERAIKLLNEIVGELKADFEPGEEITVERCRSNLEEIEPIVNCTFNWPELLAIKQHLYFIQGQCYEKLGEFSNAWCAYCNVTDKAADFYPAAIAARSILLKQEIGRRLGSLPVVQAQVSTVEIDGDDEREIEPDFLLPMDIPLLVKFHDKWARETEWFDSVDTASLDSKFRERQEKLKILIQAKEAELSLVKELLKENKSSEKWAQKQKNLKADLDKLEEIQAKLEEKYRVHMPAARKVFRRHAAESCFFKPSRSLKTAKLTTLVEAIVDQRFKLNDDESLQIDLAGISGRLLITAERVFQEAVVNLSDNNSPRLGIPVIKEKSWTVGSYYNERSGVTTYGPVERYIVGATVIESQHRVEPKRQRLGDSFLPQHGTYSNSIYPLLHRLASEETVKEKYLASLMIRYGKKHQPITLEELKTVTAEATEDDAHHFNRVCFLVMAKEQSQWHSATQESFQLGMTVSLARCLIMIEAGFIKFSDAFKNTVLFSIYSHTGLADDCSKVAESAKYVDTMYMAYLQQVKGAEHVAFFKKHVKKSITPIVDPEFRTI